MVTAQQNILQEDATNEMRVMDNNLLPTNSSLNVPSTILLEDKQMADQKWLKDVRFAIEGVTQLLVGLVGLVGKYKCCMIR